MLRQNPINKKRIEMNLKPRLLPANFVDKAKELKQTQESNLERSPSIPTDESKNRQLPIPLETQTDSTSETASELDGNEELASGQRISTESTVLSAATPRSVPANQSLPISPSIPAKRQAIEEKKPEEQNFEFYQISTILSSLFMEAPGSQLLESLQAGLSKAKERADSFYELIFEGGIATNQTPINIDKAVSCFHRAFDFSKQQRGNGDVFLQNMVWNLFSKAGGSPLVAELLERAKSELQDVSETSKAADERIEQILGELNQLPGFETTFDCLKQKKEKAVELLKTQANRSGRLSNEQSLVFFPGSSFVFQNKPEFQSVLCKPEGAYFIAIKGSGTAINPKPGFFDACHRLGISLDELKNIVLTSVQKSNAPWFDETEASFAVRNSSEKIKVFAAAEVVESFSKELLKLERLGCFEIVRFVAKTANLFDASEAELSGGGFVTLRRRSVTLKFVSPQGRVQTIQFADGSTYTTTNCDELPEKADMLVLTANDSDDLLRCLAAVKELCSSERQPSLLVFDIPKNKPELLNLADSFKQYLSNLPIAFAATSLICNPETHRFLDAVKAFDSNDPAGIWTDFLSIASSASASGEPFYFQEGKETDFNRDKADIVESLRIAQRRCRGLYFK